MLGNQMKGYLRLSQLASLNARTRNAHNSGSQSSTYHRPLTTTSTSFLVGCASSKHHENGYSALHVRVNNGISRIDGTRRLLKIIVQHCKPHRLHRLFHLDRSEAVMGIGLSKCCVDCRKGPVSPRQSLCNCMVCMPQPFSHHTHCSICAHPGFFMVFLNKRETDNLCRRRLLPRPPKRMNLNSRFTLQEQAVWIESLLDAGVSISHGSDFRNR